MGMKISGIEELEKALKDVGIGANAIAIKAVNKGAPKVKEALKQAISGTVSEGTGELAESVIVRPAKENQYGVFTTIGPYGNDSKGVSNPLKMGVLEYGRKGGVSKTGRRIAPQPPRPVRNKAVSACEAEVLTTMEAVVGEEIERLVGK